MAFELAAINPTSVPINMLNPRPGTKFGDREYMDPWEAVKWIAIFRLILPEALFRLCGGRVENLGELQPLAVKAGLNGVMMGNFLTTLGNEPRERPRDVRGARPERRAPARQRRQPASRTTARVGSPARHPTSSGSCSRARTWTPASTSLPLRSGSRRCRSACGTRPPNCASGPSADGPAAPRRRAEPRRPSAYPGSCLMSEIEAAPGRAGAPRARRGACGWSADRRDRPCCSTAGRCCCCARTTTSGWPTIPRVREAAADAAMRWGVGAGASRLVSGTMTIHGRLEERLADVQGQRGRACCSARATSPTSASIGALAGRGDTIFSDELNHASIIDGCRLARAEVIVYRHRDLEHLELVPATPSGPPRPGRRSADRDRLGVLDGRRRRAPGGDRRARRPPRRAACSWTRPTRPAASARAAAARSPRPACEEEVDVVVGTLGKSLGSYGAYACAERRRSSDFVNTRPFADLLDRPGSRPRSPGRSPRWSCSSAPPARAPPARQRPRAARRARREGFPVADGECRSCR